MATSPHAHPTVPAPSDRGLGARLDDIGWGVFLLMTGVLWLFAYAVPSGTWLVGTGLLLLALNGVRYLKGLALHGFTLVLGLLALAGGLADLANVRLPLLALAFVAFGILLLVKPFTKRNR